jgi:hypothetical protein
MDRTNSKTHSKKILVGKIHADWCGHCVNLKPEWENMKRLLKMNMGRDLKHVVVEFVDIGDTEENKKRGKTVDKMIEEFNEQHMSDHEHKLELDGGYPTIFKLGGGNLEYYKGDRNAKDMHKWVVDGHTPKNESPVAKHGGSNNKDKNKNKRSNKLSHFRKTHRGKTFLSIFDCAKPKGKTQKKRGWFF